MKSPRVVLDTNVIVSAILFGRKPRQILQLAIDRNIQAVTSPALEGELLDVLAKKFLFPRNKLLLIERKVKKFALFVYPSKTIAILSDGPDNQVLEAAQAGGCDFIVTRDSELLRLATFEAVKIVTPEQFLKIYNAIIFPS